MKRIRKSIITRGFRPREDQILFFEGPGGTAANPVSPGYFAVNPEANWSNVIRHSLDMGIAEIRRQLAQQIEVLQSIAVPLPSYAQSNHIEAQDRTSRKTGRDDRQTESASARGN